MFDIYSLGLQCVVHMSVILHWILNHVQFISNACILDTAFVKKNKCFAGVFLDVHKLVSKTFIRLLVTNLKLNNFKPFAFGFIVYYNYTYVPIKVKLHKVLEKSY